MLVNKGTQAMRLIWLKLTDCKSHIEISVPPIKLVAVIHKFLLVLHIPQNNVYKNIKMGKEID